MLGGVELKIRTRLCKASVASLAVLTVSALFTAGSVQAQSTMHKPAMMQVSTWLKPSKDKVTSYEIVRKRRLARALHSTQGNGSYICSASGFGKRSSCYKR